MGNNVNPTAWESWKESCEISDNKWPIIHSLPFKCTFETRLQSFQFSLLHRFVIHNALLFKYKLLEFEHCYFCDEKDTILHRFWTCNYVVVFWESFQRWWNSCNPNNHVNLSYFHVMFGYTNGKNYALNNSILQAKFFIHCSFLCSSL